MEGNRDVLNTTGGEHPASLGAQPSEEPTDGKVTCWLWVEGCTCCRPVHFREIRVKPKLDAIMVAARMTDSNAEAQRMIKSNSVSIQLDDDGRSGWWVKVKDVRQEIPKSWPVILKVGNSFDWVRRVPKKDGTGWNQFKSVITFMIGQTIECWSEMWRG